MADFLKLDTPILGLEGLPKRLSKKHHEALESLKIATIGDLLDHFPKRYEDRTHFDRFPQHTMETAICLRGIVDDVQRKFIKGKKGGFTEVKLIDPDAGNDGMSNPITLRWFRSPFIHKLFAVGHEVVVYGRPKMSGHRLVIDHPEHEIVNEYDPAETVMSAVDVHMGRIVPIYRLANGMPQKTLRELIFHALEWIDPDEITGTFSTEMLPERWRGLSRENSIRQVHFPDSFGDLDPARRFLAMEEFVGLQLTLLRRRAEYEKPGGKSHCGPGELFTDFLAELPFQPTDAQKRCIREIRHDLASDKPMNRLLQGDVGAGKTLVAIAAMVCAVEAGFDCALMAPTQILAEQHYIGVQKWLSPLGIEVKLRTGGKKSDYDEEGLQTFDFASVGGSHFGTVTVGTHALIHTKNPAEVFPNGLGLVVIDEQHKFGVGQRSALIAQGDMPDVLVMTATPIPRTLTLSLYGDLDVSIIDELPAGRGKIITGIRPTSKTEDAAKFINQQLEEGRQAYIVYPLIEESEKLQVAAATVEHEKWQQRFPYFDCGLLHGRMHADEKEHVMEDFRKGRHEVLVATTVIEVGVDVPNANVMLIYNAERFGLAQLHQLRGRIGRGEHKSYCILMIDPKKVEARRRLSILEETRDGFVIAETDLEQRGPGEVLGTQQSGLPDLKFAELLGDLSLVQEARELAEALFRGDARPSERLKPLAMH